MKRYNVVVNGTTYTVDIEETAVGIAAAPIPQAAPAPAPAVQPAAPAAAAPAAPQGAAGSIQVTAPMPGNILDIKVAPGQAVTAGTPLVILEAMKMENEIVAPQDGTVASVPVAKGAVVNAGDILATMN